MGHSLPYATSLAIVLRGHRVLGGGMHQAVLDCAGKQN